MNRMSRNPAFRSDNTEGYSAEQLDALNAELAVRLAAIDPDDRGEIDLVTSAFCDEVAGR